MLFNQSEIILKICTSDLFVSSKPGVSTKQMSESAIPGKESLMTEISLVLDSKLCPTIPSMPVAISMNFEEVKKSENMRRTPILTELLPAPVGPMMLHDRFQMDES